MKLKIFCYFFAFAILQVSSTGLDNLNEDEKTKALQKLAARINRNIFESRHENYPRENLTPKQQDRLGAEHNFDTAAIRLDRNNDLFVAANTKTRTNFVNKAKSFAPTEFDIREDDRNTILNTVKSDPRFDQSKVTIVQPAIRPSNKEENARDHAEMQLLKDRFNSPSRNQNRAHSTNSQRQQLAERFNRQQTAGSTLGNVETIRGNNAPTLSRRGSVIAASKPACENCSGQLRNQRIPHNSEGGLPANRITNWRSPNDMPGVQRTSYNPPSPPNGARSAGGNQFGRANSLGSSTNNGRNPYTSQRGQQNGSSNGSNPPPNSPSGDGRFHAQKSTTTRPRSNSGSFLSTSRKTG